MTNTKPVTVQLSSPSADGQRVSVVLDGQDISRFCRRVTVEAAVHSIITATVELLPSKGFALSMPAGVELYVSPMPGYVLIEETTPEGGKSWRTVRVGETT